MLLFLHQQNYMINEYRSRLPAFLIYKKVPEYTAFLDIIGKVKKIFCRDSRKDETRRSVKHCS